MKANITLTTFNTEMELTVDIDKIAVISQSKNKQSEEDKGSFIYVSGVSDEFRVKETAEEILSKIHKARCFETNEKVHITELT